jgi:hypothetical protein
MAKYATTFVIQCLYFTYIVGVRQIMYPVGTYLGL